jgi:hypothetical protein
MASKDDNKRMYATDYAE